MSNLTTTMVAICAVTITLSTALPKEGKNWLTGEPLKHELEQPITANWTKEQSRQMIKALATVRRVSVVFDRRLDPSIELPMNLQSVPLLKAFTEIGTQVHGQISLSENFVYVGPKTASDRLRTLIELRRQELVSKDAGIAANRRSELQRRRTASWDDLTSPREILETTARQFDLAIVNLEQIPHDLWSEATLPDANSVEALSVVLIQFDLTFRWTNSGKGIELIPIPDSVSIERKHRPKQKAAEALETIRGVLPGLDAKLVKGEIVATGSVEDHEAVEKLLSNKPVTRRTNPVAPNQNLRERLFTFKSTTASVRAIMKKVEESDIRFEYDQKEFQAAAIDLERKVQIDVVEATADEFFKTLFEPLGVEFQIDRTTVKLVPQRTKP